MPQPPGEWEKLHTLGYTHQLLGEWQKAADYYKQSLAIKPDYAFAQLALAQLRMLQTGFREGRHGYEARFGVRDEHNGFDWRSLPTPRWRGEPLAGKHVHLWSEQGFGDVIMYASFLPWLLTQQPARITLSAFPKMMTLLARSFPTLQVESLEDIGRHALSASLLASFPQLLKMREQTGMAIDIEPMRREYEGALARGTPDYAAPMGDLLVHGLPGFIPAQRQGAYFTADARRVAETQKQLQSLGLGRRIGISWHTPNEKSGAVRNVPLQDWLPLFNIPGCHFISLQHHVLPDEIKQFNAETGCNLIDPQLDVLHDTEGLAALTFCMDEVITIDNSTVHLAGALGVRATLLLPKGCDFRWPQPENGPDTLWYRSVHIDRQTQPMQWQPVIERVTEGLRRRF